jgi:uncharacterized membrane protein
MNKRQKRESVLKQNKKSGFRPEWLIPILILAAGIAFVAWPRTTDGKLKFGNSFVTYSRVKARDGKVSLPVREFDDGRARYYAYKFPEKTVLFFVLKSSDGVLRAAFDACDVCFHEKKGYRQDGDLMVCNNCGLTFPSVRINVEKGGCNPAPLQRNVVGDNLELLVTEIHKGERYF